MFEKLLLAATITFSLNLFIGMTAQSAEQPTVTAQSSHSSVYIAKVLHDRSFLRNLFQ